MKPVGVPQELRHRGELTVEYPDVALWERLGGCEGIEALIADLYRRMAGDDVLRHAFAHFNPAGAVPFFLQWFGGDHNRSARWGGLDDLEGGLVRRHQHRYVSPEASTAWLGCMREAAEARGVDPGPILRPLGRIANALVHSPDTPPSQLHRSCDGVQDPGQARLQDLLADTAAGRTVTVREALEQDPSFARRRGTEGQTLAWMATYRGRDEILDIALAGGADPNTPGCDPVEATMACDRVRLGTGLPVTPLALARKWRPALVPQLLAAGAVDDLFTAAWLGDLEGLRAHLDRSPHLVRALDPADDYQEVTALAHAVFGGNRECIQLVLDRGAEVRRHSGKLLTLAVLLDRPDLVALLIEHGADVQRAALLGKLDDVERPIADLLTAHGKKPPPWMLPRTCRPDVSRNELHRVRVLLDYGAAINGRGREGLTALHYAVRGGKIPLIDLLLARGADANALDAAGMPPLLHLARTRATFDPIPVLELVAAHGADVNARDERGSTLLKHYARRGNAEAIRWLVTHGAVPPD